MTTPKRTVSPAVKRALDAQAGTGWTSKTSAEPTLGDAIRADLPKGECDYCGLSVEDGDFTFADVVGPREAQGTLAGHVADGRGHSTEGGCCDPVILCQYCQEDKVLGQCGHSRTCDCLAGICE